MTLTRVEKSVLENMKCNGIVNNVYTVNTDIVSSSLTNQVLFDPFILQKHHHLISICSRLLTSSKRIHELPSPRDVAAIFSSLSGCTSMKLMQISLM